MRPNIRSKRGNVAMVVGLSMVMLVMLAALAVDLGLARTQHGQLQSALDAAALAGASAVQEGDSIVVDRAIELAVNNVVGNTALVIDAGDIDIGDFDSATDTFTTSCGACRHVRVATTVDVPTAFALAGGFTEVTIAAESIAIGSPEPIECAIFGDGSFTVGGTGNVDSYDSTDCAPGDVPCAYLTETPALTNGDTCTNGQGEVFGSSLVCGDASSGFTYVTIAEDEDVCGSTASLTGPVTIPSPCQSSNQTLAGVADGGGGAWGDGGPTTCSGTPAWPTTFDNADHGVLTPTPFDLTLHGLGGTIVLPPGSYQLNSMVGTGGANIIVDPPGPIEFWVTGDVDWGGNGLNNATQNPHDFLIVAQGNMTVTGTSDTYGTYYSYGDFTAGGTADYYGILVSHGNLKVQGTPDIHLDESLPGIIEAMIVDGPPILVF